MKQRRKLLFFGDLAPKYLSGTSIAAKTNLDMLGDEYTILHIEEGDNWLHHSTHHFSKVKKNINHAITIFKLCKKEQPSIFYSHLPSSIFGIFKMILISLAVKWSSPAKIVLHLHRGDFNVKFQKSYIFQFLTRWIDKYIDLLVVLSKNHKDSLDDIFSPKKIDILENTIEEEYKIDAIQDTSKISFLYISNYIREKGILDLLEVFEELTLKYPNIVLHTYGNFFDPSLQEEIEKFHNGQNIFIKSKIEKLEKFQVIANVNCFILPSWNEGQPLVILEAMSQGTNIIASDVGFVSEMFWKNYPYLFKGGDKSHLKETICRFIKVDEKVKNEKLLGRYHAIFSRKAHSEKLLSVFERV